MATRARSSGQHDDVFIGSTLSRLSARTLAVRQPLTALEDDATANDSQHGSALQDMPAVRGVPSFRVKP